MGLFGYLRNKLLELGKIIVVPFLPLHSNLQSLEELEEAIRIHSLQLIDPLFRHNRRYHAYAFLALAIAYYRKAYYYTEFSEADVKLAIYFAQQAESFFSRDVSLSAWKRLKEVLGNAYLLKSEGPRAEHYEVMVPYFENLLKLAESSGEVETQIELRTALLLASAGRFSGTTEEKTAKVNEHANRLRKLHAGAADAEWDRYVSELMVAGYWAARQRGLGDVSETTIDALPQIFQSVYGASQPETRSVLGFVDVFRGFTHLIQVIDPVMEKAAANISDQEAARLHKAFANHDYSHVAEVVPAEDIKLITDLFDKLIGETAAVLADESTPPLEKAEIDLVLAIFYFQKAPFESLPVKESKSLALARYHFERSWETFLSVARPFSLFMNSRLFGTCLYFRYGMWPEAERLYALALAGLEQSYQASLGMQGKLFVLLGVSGESLSVPLLLNQAYVLARQEKPQEAIVLLEKWRGRQLNERLKQTDRQLLQVLPDDLASYQNALKNIFRLEAAQRDKQAAEYLELTGQFREAQALLEKIIERIRGYVPGFLAEPTFADVVQATTARQPLAYLLTTEVGSLTMLVNESGDVRCLWADQFTSYEVDILLEKQLSALKLSQTSGEVETAAVLAEILPELGAQLAAPLMQELKKLGTDAVCLIPCGPLALLPLHAATLNGEFCASFIESDGDDPGSAGGISYAPSATILSQSRHRLAELNQQTVAGISRLVGIANPSGDLKYAVAEVDAIAAFFGWPHSAVVLRGESAGKETVRVVLREATHIHFACHGEFDAAEPLQTALVLANRQLLTLRDVFDESEFQRLPAARMVVLSACKTALIDFQERPEEVMGLPAGFLAAGVPGVVGTLWSVDDLSTAILMTRFYENLIKHSRQPARALGEAQKWLRQSTWEELELFCSGWPELGRAYRTREAAYGEHNARLSGPHPFANPYFWAGFIFVGA